MSADEREDEAPEDAAPEAPEDEAPPAAPEASDADEDAEARPDETDAGEDGEDAEAPEPLAASPSKSTTTTKAKAKPAVAKPKPKKKKPAPKRRADRDDELPEEDYGDGATIRAVRLSKWYGKVTAVSDVSLHLGPGIWGLLGPNGSGKTTFMRMIAGQIRPSTGKLLVNGESPFGNPRVLARMGYCPEADSLYDELTGLEFVTAMAELSGYDSATAKKRATAALEEFGLHEAMERKMGGYSRGMRQRAKLAQAIVHEPDVLLLDEPLTGTDPTSRQGILDSLRARAKKGALVLFSTHVLPEIEAITDRVLLIARGQVVAQGTMESIRELLDEHPHHIRVHVDRPRELASMLLANESGIAALHFPTPYLLEVRTWNPDETYQAIARQVLAGGFELGSITSPDANLEALFHYLVERANRGAGTGADAGSGAMAGLTSAAEKSAYQQQLDPGARR